MVFLHNLLSKDCICEHISGLIQEKIQKRRGREGGMYTKREPPPTPPLLKTGILLETKKPLLSLKKTYIHTLQLLSLLSCEKDMYIHMLAIIDKFHDPSYINLYTTFYKQIIITLSIFGQKSTNMNIYYIYIQSSSQLYISILTPT